MSRTQASNMSQMSAQFGSVTSSMSAGWSSSSLQPTVRPRARTRAAPTRAFVILTFLSQADGDLAHVARAVVFSGSTVSSCPRSATAARSRAVQRRVMAGRQRARKRPPQKLRREGKTAREPNSAVDQREHGRRVDPAAVAEQPRARGSLFAPAPLVLVHAHDQAIDVRSAQLFEPSIQVVAGPEARNFEQPAASGIAAVDELEVREQEPVRRGGGRGFTDQIPVRGGARELLRETCL